MNSFMISLPPLLWKDFKLVAPLAVILVACSIVLHFVIAISIETADEKSALHGLILLALPCCYALAAGAVLVSREKETRSLIWLQSMPIDYRLIARSKLIVALASLLALWGITSLLHYIATWDEHGGIGLFQYFYTTEFSGYFIPAAFTLPILLIGLFWGWCVRRPFLGVTLTLPTFLAVYVAGYLIIYRMIAALLEVSIWDAIQAILGRSSIMPHLYDRYYFAAHLVVCTFAFFMADKASMRYLKHEPIQWTNWLTWLGKRRENNRAAIASHTGWSIARSTYAPTSALIWQSIQQNRWVGIVLFGLTALLIVPSPVIVQDDPSYPSAQGVWKLTFLGFFDAISAQVICAISALIVGWIGTLVFHGESPKNLRFLAERGVTPHTFWSARFLVGVSSLCAFLLLALFLLNLRFPSEMGLGRYPRFLHSAATVSLVLFSLSSWFAMFFRQLIVAAVAAPALALIATSVLVVATRFHFPWNIASLLWILLPVVATRLNVRDWMDGRLGIRYWGIHASALAIGILVPILCFVAVRPTTDQISTLKAKLQERWDDQKLEIPLKTKVSFDELERWLGSNKTPERSHTISRYVKFTREQLEQIGASGFGSFNLLDSSEPHAVRLQEQLNGMRFNVHEIPNSTTNASRIQTSQSVAIPNWEAEEVYDAFLNEEFKKEYARATKATDREKPTVPNILPYFPRFKFSNQEEEDAYVAHLNEQFKKEYVLAAGTLDGTSITDGKPPQRTKRFASVEDLEAYADYLNEQLNNHLNRSPSQTTLDQRLAWEWIQRATRKRAESQWDDYRTTIEFFNRYLTSVVPTTTVFEQDVLEACNRWLLDECLVDESRTHLGDSLYRAIIERIGDREGLYAARRASILRSWKAFEEEIAPTERSKVIAKSERKNIWRDRRDAFFRPPYWKSRSHFEVISSITEIVDCLDEAEKLPLGVPADNDLRSAREKLGQRVQDALALSTSDFWGNRAPLSESDQFAVRCLGGAIGSVSICGLWFGDWENTALRLKKELDSTTKPKASVENP